MKNQGEIIIKSGNYEAVFTIKETDVNIKFKPTLDFKSENLSNDALFVANTSISVMKMLKGGIY